MDYDINSYLDPDEDIIPYEERDQSWKDQFEGSLDEKPESEIQLFKWQDEFLRTRDMKVWKKMYDFCFWYIRSMILKRCTGKLFLEPEEVFDKTSTATMEFMQQYLNNPYFEVGTSFAGMMKWKIVWVLYKDKDQEKSISLNKKIFNTEKEIGDVYTAKEEIINNVFEEDFIKFDLDGFLKNLFDILDKELNYEPRLEVLVRLYILMYVKGPKSINTEKLFFDRFATNVEIKKILEYSIIMLHEILKESAEISIISQRY